MEEVNIDAENATIGSDRFAGWLVKESRATVDGPGLSLDERQACWCNRLEGGSKSRAESGQIESESSQVRSRDVGSQ